VTDLPVSNGSAAEQSFTPRSVQRYASGGVVGQSHQILHILRKVLRPTNSAFLGSIARRFDLLAQPFRKKYLPLHMRALISLLQPIDPLRRARDLPPIELVIPFVEKDLRALPTVLANALSMVRNPIELITLVTPSDPGARAPRLRTEESRRIFHDIVDTHPQLRVVFDDDLLGPELRGQMDRRFGEGDRNAGWVIQQLIKLSAAMHSEFIGALILDADTVLLSPKTWIRSDKKQLLQVANEYHADFMRHVFQFFGVPKKYRLSFITHHQLMQPEVVRMMFPRGAQSLIEWWESSTDPIGRDLGDYEAYGSYLAHHFPERVAYGSFGNLFSPHWDRFERDLRVTGLRPEELIPDYCSVSFHSWAQVPADAEGN